MIRDDLPSGMGFGKSQPWRHATKGLLSGGLACFCRAVGAEGLEDISVRGAVEAEGFVEFLVAGADIEPGGMDAEQQRPADFDGFEVLHQVRGGECAEQGVRRQGAPVECRATRGYFAA